MTTKQRKCRCGSPIMPDGLCVDQAAHDWTRDTGHTAAVVTYQSPSGARMDICDPCKSRMKADGWWPRDARGEEFCAVSHGAHAGNCVPCTGSVRS